MVQNMGAPTAPPPPPGVTVVTGGASGIGAEIARGVAARGFTTVIVARDGVRAQAVASEIARATGNSRVEALTGGDLASIANVRALATQLAGRYPAIQGLVNNAGAYFVRRELTADGLERTFALNVLAPFLLTYLLADRLRAATPARVVNIASAAHRGAKIDFTDLQGARQFSGYRAYGTSKLELILLTREFARRFGGTGVTVNAVHPGFVASGFAQNNGGGVAAAIRVLGFLFGKSVRRGAITPIFVATDPSVASVSGEYFSSRKVNPGDPASRDLAAAAQLYTVCAGLTGVPASGP